MKISVITVCKNSESHIEKAIQSVLSQTYQDIEYIIIDGESSDRTLDIINRYSKQISKVVSEPDNSVYDAMNKGIQLATGDFLFFLNSDDYLPDEKVLEDVVTFIHQQPRCDFVYGNLEIRPSHQPPVIKKPYSPDKILQGLVFLDGPLHPASFFRRELFSLLGLFDESYKIAADYEWFLRLVQDSSLAIHYYPRTINSFSTGGLSNHSQKKSLIELFDAQNKAAIYQTPYWLEKRILKFQELLLDLYEKLQQQEQLRQQIQAQSVQPESTNVPNAALRNPAQVMSRNAALRNKLASLVTPHVAPTSLPKIRPLADAEVIITPNEVNDRHGTGILVKRIFSSYQNVLSIRSINSYNGEHDFGDASVCLSYTGMSRPEIYSTLLQVLNGTTIKRIVCIAYLADDVRSAIALKDLFNVPLCTYLMDDNNIYSKLIPDDLMRELLQKSSVRFVISPEMRDAYQIKYNVKFWLLPPVVASQFIRSEPNFAIDSHPSQTGILIGNVWGKYWLELLQQTICDSHLQIDWFTNPGQTPYEKDQLKESGIVVKDDLPGEKLISIVEQYPYAIMPTGTLDENDDLAEVARLSLPSRLIFLIAANVPVIVMGHKNTGAAKFVERFGIGIVCDYNASSFEAAVQQICTPEMQRSIRKKCAELAPAFSADSIAEWIWRSLELGEAADLRFEKLLPALPNSLYPYLEAPVPKELWGDFIPLYEVVRRLKNQGFKPDFVIDIGASIGSWSHTVNMVLPETRYILIDPLASRYDANARKYYTESHPNFEVLEVAVSNQEGTTSFQVSPDLAGSSLLHPKDFRSYETVDIRVATLDQLAQEKALTGRGFLKIDVQCAEHLVLEGAKKLLDQIDVLAVELSLPRYDEGAKVYVEMLQLIDQLGFRYYDDIGSWRSPVDGTLLQRDVLCVRKELFKPLISS